VVQDSDTGGGRFLDFTCGTAGLHKMRSVSWLTEKLLASKEGRCSMALVHYLEVGPASFTIHKAHLSFRQT